MKLEDFYAALGGDLEGTMERICSRRLVERFVLRFLSEESFPALEKALSEGNYEDAFRAAHSLKGTASNIGFTRLFEASDALTEALRGGERPQDEEILMFHVREEYERTMALLRKFQCMD